MSPIFVPINPIISQIYYFGIEKIIFIKVVNLQIVAITKNNIRNGTYIKVNITLKSLTNTNNKI